MLRPGHAVLVGRAHDLGDLGKVEDRRRRSSFHSSVIARHGLDDARGPQHQLVICCEKEHEHQHPERERARSR